MMTDFVDEDLFHALHPTLKRADAQHLMLAVHNGCEWLVTLDDRDFLPKRGAVEKFCRGLRIVRPSELTAHLGY